MDNHEDILDALTAFGKNPNPQEIPSVLEQYLNSVAKNGETLFPWSQLKPLILRKMELVILELRRNLASENIPTRPNVENVRFDVIHARIIDSLHKFNGAPFTIQRLCELLMDPKRHYKRSDKFMRGLEKNVLVVSTVDPFGRKVVSELGNKPVLNGILDINGSFPPRDTALSVPLPPVPGWVNTAAAANRNAATGATGVDSVNKTGGSGNSLDPLGKDSNGLSVSGAQVFSDQGDPLAVQSEEVVEETVVTMDTGEVSSVDTDGGEALAEREVEGDIVEDRDASSFSSSSSSSSSEELSTSSDSIENGLRSSTSPLGMAGPSVSEEVTAMDESRPWAAFAQDMKQQQDDLGTASSNKPVTEENQTSGVSSSSLHDIGTADAPSSSSLSSSSSSVLSETQSSLPSTSSTITSESEEYQQQQQQKDESPVDSHQTVSSDQSNWQQSSCDQSSTADSNQSSGIDTATTSPQEAHDTSSSSSSSSSSTITTATTDKLISSSTCTVIPTTTTTSTVTDNSNNVLSDIHTSSSLASIDTVTSVPQPPTYAQVVASSTTDKMSSSLSSIQHISPYDSTTEPVPACDSVAGLERLVGSVEQTLSSSSSSSSSPSPTVCPSSSSSLPSSSHPPCATNTTSHINNSSAVTTSSLPESSQTSTGSTSLQTAPSQSSQCGSSEEGEPVTKRMRLSVDEENMEEDCISTSGDACMEEGQNSIEAEQEEEEQQKEGGAGTVHSSSVEGEEEPLQHGEVTEDIQMEEEGDGCVTTGTSEVDSNENKEGGVELESSTSDCDAVNSEHAGDDEKEDISNTESSTVSTTDGDSQNTS